MHLSCLALMVALFAACGATVEHDKVPGHAPGERIGTYDGRAVAIAYTNSDVFREWIGEVRKQHDEAEAKGDQARADACAAKAMAKQERLHGQAFDGDSIDDVLQQVAAALPAICKQAGVVRLEQVNRERPASVETVDVTDQLVALFHPDERALGWIADIRGQPFPK